MRETVRISVWVMICAVMTTGLLRADIISVDQFSAADPADLLTAGPHVHVPKTNIGLTAGDELDAMSQGLDIVTGHDIVYFSVDGLSVGLPGPFTAWNYDVAGQAAYNQVPGDIFVTTDPMGVQSAPMGVNYLSVNQHEFGLMPNGVPMGLPWVPAQGASENLDAYSMEEFDYDADGLTDMTVYFSLAAGSPTLGAISAGAADILWWDQWDNRIDVLFSAADLGLDAGLDDIDALALNMVGGSPGAYFSLAPGSISLAGADGVFATGDDLSAADVFYSDLQGNVSVAYPSILLGLEPTDNVDALETNALIPEPATLVLLFIAAAGLMWRRR